MWKTLLLATVLFTHATLSAAIFSWTDASGNIVYGDSPPDSAVAKSVAPPKLTILENFANRYTDENTLSRRSGNTSLESNASQSKSGNKGRFVKAPYTALKIIAPKADQLIRANDGDVSIALSTSPKLRAGDKVIIHLDGQLHSSIKSRVANLSGLERGEHKLMVEIKSASGESLLKSGEIRFNVLRNSVITNKKKPYNPYDGDPSQ